MKHTISHISAAFLVMVIVSGCDSNSQEHTHTELEQLQTELEQLENQVGRLEFRLFQLENVPGDATDDMPDPDSQYQPDSDSENPAADDSGSSDKRYDLRPIDE